jgi:parallel beta-helix repeat protein
MMLGWAGLNAATVSVSNGAQLQSALNSANNGDVILLADGTYTVSSGFYDPTIPYEIRKSITVKSSSGNAANVILSGPSGTTFMIMRIGANNVTLDSVTLSQTLTQNGFGLYVADYLNQNGGTLSGITLRNVTVSVATAGRNTQGISFNQVTSSFVDRCTVSADFHAIALGNGSNGNLITNNTIPQTTGTGNGILLEISDRNTVVGNTISNIGNDGVSVTGGQYNYVGLNTITAPKNGVTVTNYIAGLTVRNPIRNYVGNNVLSLTGKSGSDGIWFNNDASWNMAFANDATGAQENGIAIFNSVGNSVRGNYIHQNPQGGIFLSMQPGNNTTPANNTIQRNYLYRHGANGGVITDITSTTNTQIGFNFIAGDPAVINSPIAGFVLQKSTGDTVYGNVIRDFYEGEVIGQMAAANGVSIFGNRYFNDLNHYTFTGSGVTWDSGSNVLGGNFFSDFTSANGNPSNGSTPYTNILNNQNNTNNRGVYQDNYPYQSENLGKLYGVTVRTPASGIYAAVGSQRTISWISQGCVLVDLALLNSSNSATAIASNYADTGFYRWTVPSVAPGAYRVQVTCKTSAGANTGTSAVGQQFNITTSDLVLLSPQSDQIFDPGQNLLVSWKKSANVTQPVTVNIRYADGNSYALLTSGVSGDFVSFPVPNGTSNRVSIQIVSGSFSDSTDEWFNIRSGNGSVTSPSTFASLYVGTPFPVEWVGPPGSDYVNVDLVSGNNTRNLVTGLADFGRYDMLVPDFRGPATVRVTFFNSAGGTIGTASSGSVTIQQGTLFSNDLPAFVVSASPTSGSGSGTTFTLVVADLNGAPDITSAVFLVNSSLTGNNGCFVNYTPGNNSIALANNAVTAWSTATLGSSTLLTNSQCTVNPALATAVASGDTLTVTIPVTFAAAFAGAKTTWGYANDQTGFSNGYQVTGSWTVPGGAAKIGIFNPSQAIFLLDANGNFTWDGTGSDKYFPWGTANHNPKYIVVTGDWNGSGTKKVGIFDPATATWLLDYNGDGVYTPGVDKLLQWGSPNDIPVVGDWNGNGTTKIGTFGPTTGLWLLDYNGNYSWDGAGTDRYFPWGSPGDTPLVGDWNGSGTSKVGTFGPNTGLWLLDYNGNSVWDGPSVDKYFPWGSGGDKPMLGDWNGSGTTKVGTFGPNTGLWLLDYNGNFTWDGPSVDRYFPWGSGGDTPVVGDWNGSGTTKVGTYGPTTALWLLDYNGNFTWDGAAVDKYFPWGSPGDTPVIGKW